MKKYIKTKYYSAITEGIMYYHYELSFDSLKTRGFCVYYKPLIPTKKLNQFCKNFKSFKNEKKY